MTGELRLIRPLRLPSINHSQDLGELPRFEWMRPTTLFVDEKYQRGLSKRSISLIRKVVRDWNWNRMKPPIVVEHENGYEVIDGQHTAIAAATHPHINSIPVLVVKAGAFSERAEAFVRHNADRIAITPPQLFHARVAAGNEDAIAVQRIATEAGLKILKSPKLVYEPGDTVAVQSLMQIYTSAGPAALRRVCEIVAYGKLTPVPSVVIKAIRVLVSKHPDFMNREADADIQTAVRRRGNHISHLGKKLSAESGKRNWECITALLGSDVRDIWKERHGHAG
jgi:hypothetical protein